MLCPVCDGDMAIVELEGVELDACPKCKGLWFDADELSVLFQRIGAAGDAGSVGASLAGVRGPRSKRRCPRCRRKLAEVEVAPGPPPIRLDRCRKGDGLWFDRDELPRLLASSPSSKAVALGAVSTFLGRFAAPERSERC
jgi:Zn-finger nucleic acid-binding protein